MHAPSQIICPREQQVIDATPRERHRLSICRVGPRPSYKIPASLGAGAFQGQYRDQLHSSACAAVCARRARRHPAQALTHRRRFLPLLPGLWSMTLVRSFPQLHRRINRPLVRPPAHQLRRTASGVHPLKQWPLLVPLKGKTKALACWIGCATCARRIFPLTLPPVEPCISVSTVARINASTQLRT